MRLADVVSWRLYEYRSSILPVSAATRARRVPGAAAVVGAVVGGRSVSRKLVGADGGARFGAVQSKHGEMNRKGPRASRLCFGAMREQSTRGGWSTIWLCIIHGT
jgi:hypothetical protein